MTEMEEILDPVGEDTDGAVRRWRNMGNLFFFFPPFVVGSAPKSPAPHRCNIRHTSQFDVWVLDQSSRVASVASTGECSK
nr:hypothetical protein Itr_chr12CG07380 [Ipomoea trifida]